GRDQPLLVLLAVEHSRLAVRLCPSPFCGPTMRSFVFLAFAGTALSLSSLSAQAPADSARRGPVDRAELEAFVDGVITAQMANDHVAGAQVSVVRNGVVLLSRGYGFADVARRKPVDPATTLFRPGSVTKLFTWTAVMQ